MISLLIMLTSALIATAETILVSDIDDTIKVSHVLDKDSAIANALSTSGAFLGMPELYQFLKKDGLVDKFIYLSNAPRFLMHGQHIEFLARNKFPNGDLVLKESIRTKNHKARSIRNIILDQRPQRLILVGDNGEHDTEVYAQIKTEFPKLDIKTFIHQAYSVKGFEGDFGRPLQADQTAYATSLDLAATMLSDDSFHELLMAIAPRALAEGYYETRHQQLMFPAWLDCRDVRPVMLPRTRFPSLNIVLDFEAKLNFRCSRLPFED